MTVSAVKSRRFFTVFIIGTLALLITVWFSVFCRVKTVTVENNEKISDTVILSQLNIMPYRHIYSFSEKKMEADLLALSPYIKSARMERNLPSELVIVLEEYAADYYIIENDRCYLISDTLFVLEEIPLTEIGWHDAAYLALPEIKEDKYYSLSVGTTIRFTDKTDDAYIASLLQNVAESPFASRLTSLTLDEKANITADIEGKYHLKFGNAKEFEKKLSLCAASIDYLSENMVGVKGTLHAWTTENITFEITGVAENP
ncbi:MAG: FtsQ-type POTRA domain-containing protein [Clostridia bacterium]|nr:FtsQ-type POTRA domain-containing protein [Clostridia bacterium]